MSSEVRHRDQYFQNRNFLEYVIIGGKAYDAWAITVMFYCGLHLVEMLLAQKSIHTGASKEGGSHSQRTNLIFRYLGGSGGKVYTPYHSLEMLSREMRYDCISPNQEDFTNAQMFLTELELLVNTKS